jgi:hypothetical protein
MFRFLVVFCCTVVFLVLLRPAAAQDKPIRAADVPREFKGTFTWRDQQGSYMLTLKIDKIEEKDGLIRFSGTHFYKPSDCLMKVEGVIDPKSLVVSIRETEASLPGAILNGSFGGTLSKDLQSLEAVWTTTDTRNKADIKLQAEKPK